MLNLIKGICDACCPFFFFCVHLVDALSWQFCSVNLLSNPITGTTFGQSTMLRRKAFCQAEDEYENVTICFKTRTVFNSV